MRINQPGVRYFAVSPVPEHQEWTLVLEHFVFCLFGAHERVALRGPCDAARNRPFDDSKRSDFGRNVDAALWTDSGINLRNYADAASNVGGGDYG